MLRFSAVLASMIATQAFSFSPAQAQASVATVNGEIITARDVEQRMKVSNLVLRKPMNRDVAIKELIDDKVKINEGRRIGMRTTPAFLEDIFARTASSARQTPLQFEQNLVKAGIDPDALRAKFNADAIWSELLRVRVRSTNISNAELNAELEQRAAKGEAKITDYVIRQVIFVVPQGGNAAQRERDANAARARFNDCDSGVDYMRTLADVAIKERVARKSTDLAKGTNDLLAKTPIGRLTAPFRSEQGIELIAVCEKNERDDPAALRAIIEQEILAKRAQGTAEPYLNELRSKVEIRR